MDYSKLTLSLVGAFLVLNLIVGLWFGRKATSIRDYALANKSYGVAPLVMTFLATVVGGVILFVRAKDIFNLGINAVYSILSFPLALFLVAKYLAPKMVKFKDCLSLGDVIGKLYGTDSKILAGILTILFNCVISGVNIAFLGLIFEKFLGLNSNLGIISGGILVSLYTCVGGMRAVTATDIFQFVFLIVSLVIIAIFAVQKIGSVELLLNSIPANKFELLNDEKSYYLLTLTFSDILFFRFLTSPPYMDRILMARSPYELRRMLYISGVVLTVIIILIAIISFSALVIDPNMNPSNIMLYVVNNLLPSSLRGVAVVGIIAVVFSSADSYMHSAGVALSINVLKPIREKFGLKTNELQWAKIGTALSSILAIWLALGGEKSFRLDYSRIIIVPVLSVPLILGIIGIKPEKRAFWISSIVATATLLVCKTAHPVEYPILSSMALVIATFASAITYIVANISINAALYIVEDTGYNDPTASKWIPKPERILNILVNIITYPLHFAKSCRQKLLKYGAPFELFGAFYCIVLVAPYFLWPQEPSTYADLILYLRLLGVFLCALLMTVKIWPQITVKYIAAFWFIVLTYCLPFLSTLMVILTNGNIECIINVAITIMFLLLLVDWVSALSMAIIGAVAAVLLYKYGIDPTHVQEIQFSFNTKYLLVYQIAFASIIGLLFSRKKQTLLTRLRSLNSNLSEKLVVQNADLEGIASEDERVDKGLAKREIDLLSKIKNLEESYRNLVEVIPQDNNNIERYNENINTLKYLVSVIENAKDYLKLNVETVHIDRIIGFVDQIANIYANDNYSIVTRTDSHEIGCDCMMLQNVLCEGFIQVANNNPNDDHIIIDVSDTKIKSHLKSLPNYEKIVDAYRFTISTASYLDKSNFKDVYEIEFKNPKDTPPLVEIGAEEAESNSSISNSDIVKNIMNRRIITAHCGVAEVLNTDEGYTHIYVVPKQVRALRHLPLDLKTPDEVIITWPGALELENTLKEKIQQQAPKIDLSKIDKALDVIKKYHSHQTRKSGEPYYLHPVHVAMIELDWCQEETAILGALMHDLLEDTAFTIFDIKSAFGDRVAEVVFGVSKLDEDLRTFHNNDEHLMTLEKLTDFVTLSIKISDRIHNMRTISGHKSRDKRHAIANETLKFFVPLAKRLGLEKAYVELKEMAERELGK